MEARPEMYIPGTALFRKTMPGGIQEARIPGSRYNRVGRRIDKKKTPGQWVKGKRTGKMSCAANSKRKSGTPVGEGGNATKGKKDPSTGGISQL